MNTIKKPLTKTPVLRYYDVNKPISVQCDASQSGLGAEVHIQKWNSQVTQASSANAGGPTKVQPWSAMQERYTHAYCTCILHMHWPVYLKTTDGMQTKLCEIHLLETVDHEEHIQIEPPKQDVFHDQIAADGDIQELIHVIKLGWPDKKKCPPAVQPCYDKWNKLIKSQGLVFRGKQLVLPLPLRGTCKLSSTVVTLALEDVFAVLVKFFTGQEWVLK